MRVAVFRAEADGLRTAARLAALGHAAVPAPVIRIVPTGAAIPSDGVAGVVFTSAHAPEALDGNPAIPALDALPCWCVGDATAAAARASGFARSESGAGDAARLADLVRAQVPVGACVLLLAGRDRKPTMEAGLSAAGVKVRTVDVYWAEAVPDWSAATVDRLRRCDAAVHYSRRSAALAAALAAAHGLSDEFRLWRHYCLSRDAAEPLRALGVPYLHHAAVPDEASLLAGLPSSIRPVLDDFGQAAHQVRSS